MPESTPVAVIGVGHMGRHHARLYSEMPEAELVAVVDRRLDRAQEIAAKFHTEAFPSLDELPARVAAASVAVPTSAHRAVAEALLARGVAVLVEKPLALTMDDGRKLVEFADRSGVLLSVGHTERFNPVVRALRRLEIEPRFIETDRISPFSFRSADIGVVADMMIHDLDVLLHLMERGAERRRPKVTRVDAVGVSVLGPHEDVVNARIEFENGTVAN
ncbi:MAG: Gfo/Idh/MocA family oxidoreductase, partial [Phycisphaerae bacterium]